MGLKKTHQTKFGITANEAYHKITHVRGDDNGGITFFVDIYYDEAARDNGGDPLERHRHVVPQEFVSKLGVAHELYEVLKKNSMYAEAVDVFEDGVFPSLADQYFQGAYILTANLSDGYTVVDGNIENSIISGKIILNGKIVYGSFSGVNAIKVETDGYGVVKKGFILDGYADGHVVQNLIF